MTDDPQAKLPITNKITKDQKSDSIYLEASQIRSLDDLIKACDIDLDEWIIDRHIINKWEVGASDGEGNINVTPLFQVKCWLKPKKAEEKLLSQFRSDLIQDLKAGEYHTSYTVNYIPNYVSTPSSCLLSPNLYDVHLGKVSWHEESGENYDYKIAQNRFFDAIEDLLQKSSGHKIDEILLSVGHDFFNSDKATPYPQTTAGTPQQDDLRWQQLVRVGHSMWTKAIHRCLEIAPVRVKLIPGNHDEERNFYLGEILNAVFHNNKLVDVDNSPKLRKYYQYYQNLFGLTHGNNEKPTELFSLMANEAKELWSKTSFREFLLGHFHTKKEISYKSTEDYNGMIIRYMRSLSATDAWHFKRGYCGSVKGAEAFIYSKDEGMISFVNHNLK